MKKRILTGITTTGTPHIGNYIGAIRPALEMAKDSSESFFFLADYHSIIKNNNSKFVCGLGDNIYDNGCNSVDDKQFVDKFEKHYKHIPDSIKFICV